MELDLRAKKIAGLIEIAPKPLTDHRGTLVRLYDLDVFKKLKIRRSIVLVQESLFYTARKNTIRGLHFSLPPLQESKVITALRGLTQWVSVDLRKASPTFGLWDSTILDGKIHNSLVADAGFAHGCLSLTDHCELLIKTDRSFEDINSAGIIWNDKTLGIDWQLTSPLNLIISEEHQKLGTFEEFSEKYLEEL